MKRLGLFILLSIFLGACGVESDEEIFARNIEEIEQYLSDNNLNADVTDSGLHYIIHAEGGPNHPNQFNEVVVDYTGKTLEDFQFDSGEGVSLDQSKLVQGWVEGLGLIGRDGEITMFLPSILAYGGDPPAGSGIKENAPIIFNVSLLDFN